MPPRCREPLQEIRRCGARSLRARPLSEEAGNKLDSSHSGLLHVVSHRSLSLYSGVPGAQTGGESGDQAGAGGGNMATTAAATRNINKLRPHRARGRGGRARAARGAGVRGRGRAPPRPRSGQGPEWCRGGGGRVRLRQAAAALGQTKTEKALGWAGQGGTSGRAGPRLAGCAVTAWCWPLVAAGAPQKNNSQSVRAATARTDRRTCCQALVTFPVITAPLRFRFMEHVREPVKKKKCGKFHQAFSTFQKKKKLCLKCILSHFNPF